MIQSATGAPAHVISQPDAVLDAHKVDSNPAPEVDAGHPGPRKTFDEIKADLLKKFTGSEDIDDVALKAGSEPKPDTGSATTEIDGVTDEELAAFVNRSKESRAQRQKLRQLESELPKAEIAKQIAAAVAEGNHYKAAQLAGIDMTKATMQALGEAPKDEKADEVAKIKAEFEAFKAAQETEKQQAAETAAKERGRSEIVAAVTKDTTKYPVLSKDEAGIRAALATAEELYDQIAAEKKRALTRDEAQRLMNACLDEAEARKRPTKKPSDHSPQPSQPSQRQATTRSTRPAIPTSPTKPLSFEEAKALIRRK